MKLHLIFAMLLFALAAPAYAQGSGTQPAVTVERITVHGAALEGNLEGDSPDRHVIVYLPPSYARNHSRRYPVVYALHGYSIDNERWTTEIHPLEGLQAAYAAGAREMIVVLPDARTLHNGSMYSSSVTIGDWETFITHDLVAYIDAHYRTIADRRSRGLAGHSMGGYGVVRLGMKHPEVYSTLYIMSPCCMSSRGAPPDALLQTLAALKTPDEASHLGFFERATLASAAAWSPNPQKPPFFIDLPIGDDATKQMVLAEWAANAPLAMVGQHIYDLRRYNAISMDVGDQDGLRVDAAELNRILNANGIATTFEIYPGDHVNHVADRFQNHVLPFFSEHLAFR